MGLGEYEYLLSDNRQTLCSDDHTQDKYLRVSLWKENSDRAINGHRSNGINLAVYHKTSILWR